MVNLTFSEMESEINEVDVRSTKGIRGRQSRDGQKGRRLAREVQSLPGPISTARAGGGGSRVGPPNLPGEALKEAGDATERAVEEAGDAIKDAAESVGDNP